MRDAIFAVAQLFVITIVTLKQFVLLYCKDKIYLKVMHVPKLRFHDVQHFDPPPYQVSDS